jgi:hypothetical protein
MYYQCLILIRLLFKTLLISKDFLKRLKQKTNRIRDNVYFINCQYKS